LLSTLGKENGALSTRERVDRNVKLFKRKSDVHFGITVRNRLVHTDSEDQPPTVEEVQRAREHLGSAVRGLGPHLATDLRGAVTGGRIGAPRWAGVVRALVPAFAFFGAWQLFAVLAGFLVDQLGGLRGGRWFTLLIGLVLLNQFLVPRCSRWIRGMTFFLRAMFVSYLIGLGLAIRGLVLWSSGVSQAELTDGYCGIVGDAGAVLESVLGLGVWAFAPWLVLSREETWEEIARLDALSLAVYLAPVLLMIAAYLWAFAPARTARKTAGEGAESHRMGTWIAYGFGIFLLLERIAHLFG